ncbi:MAG: ArsR family transcriptional regulator [Candidatus Lokiarchaeota archaeon]|nr:ArsR family transcriptional regulator [Candidatus Lokiarchaeota archaeon]
MEIKTKILELLKNSHLGLSIRSISERLNHSRTTVTKYLKILEEEDLISEHQISQYKVWILKDNLLLEKRNYLIFSIVNSILKNLTKLDLKKDDIKNLGKLVATEMNFQDFIDVSIINKFRNKIKKGDFPKPEELANGILEIIDSIISLYDDYTWDRPPIINKDGSITIRMRNSDLISNPNHYYLISGFIEYEMQEEIQKTQFNTQTKVNVNVIQILEKEKIVDFLFELNTK